MINEVRDWHMAVVRCGVEMLPRLRVLTHDERRLVMQEASDWSAVEPLWLLSEKRKLAVQSWSDKSCSPAQVMALIVFGLWVQLGEREDSAPALWADWPEILSAMGDAER
jgi:hypothetical protein